MPESCGINIYGQDYRHGNNCSETYQRGDVTVVLLDGLNPARLPQYAVLFSYTIVTTRCLLAQIAHTSIERGNSPLSAPQRSTFAVFAYLNYGAGVFPTGRYGAPVSNGAL